MWTGSLSMLKTGLEDTCAYSYPKMSFLLNKDCGFFHLAANPRHPKIIVFSTGIQTEQRCLSSQEKPQLVSAVSKFYFWYKKPPGWEKVTQTVRLLNKTKDWNETVSWLIGSVSGHLAAIWLDVSIGFVLVIEAGEFGSNSFLRILLTIDSTMIILLVLNDRDKKKRLKNPTGVTGWLGWLPWGLKGKGPCEKY